MEMELIKVLEKIRGNQETVDMLLSQNKIASGVHLKDVKLNVWFVETLYSKADATMGFTTCGQTDGAFPEHVHEFAVEYLVCVKGTVALTFGANGCDGLRILKEGDCAAIPASVLHSSKPLAKETKLAFVCVPQDDKIPLPDEKDMP